MSLNWLFLDLNSYFASVEQAERPELQGRPVAVVPMLADTTCCLAASYPAKRRGVKTGTTIRDAKRLCPGIVFIQADHRKYVRYHKRILEVVDLHLPIKKVLSIDEMACELIGSERLEENARAKAAAIKRGIIEGISPALTCSVGIAPNRYLAKVASDMQKPDGLTVIHQNEIISKLSRLEPRDFPGVGPRMEERFHARRCYTAEQMFQIPISEMTELWGGVNGERFFYLIRGQNLPEVDTKRSSISHSKVLAPGERSLNAAWPVVVRLLTKACARLRDEEFYSKEVWLSIKFGDRHPTERSWHAKAKLFETKDSLKIIDEVTKLWQEVPRRPILRVGIALTSLVDAGHHQLNLFEDKRRDSLMETLDSVNNRFKESTLYVADAQPALKTRTNAIAFQRIPGEKE
jgi:DNA polymerase-4